MKRDGVDPPLDQISKAKRGPTNKSYPVRIVSYDTEQGAWLLEMLAARWGCSAAAALRRMVRERAEAEGIRAS